MGHFSQNVNLPILLLFNLTVNMVTDNWKDYCMHTVWTDTWQSWEQQLPRSNSVGVHCQ